jgi:GDP-mannose pyrophosphatase NudK
MTPPWFKFSGPNSPFTFHPSRFTHNTHTMAGKVEIKKEEILSDDKYTLKKVIFDLEGETQERQVYDRGNGATILLYNKSKKTVILTRQFRLPSFLNGNRDGMLIETCAGFLDGDDPESCVRRESEEETGYRLKEVKKVFEAYSSPGGLTEIIHYFVAPYAKDQKVNEGGGLDEEQENIQTMEIAFDKALDMLDRGEIRDAKTIILLLYAKANRLLE